MPETDPLLGGFQAQSTVQSTDLDSSFCGPYQSLGLQLHLSYVAWLHGGGQIVSAADRAGCIALATDCACVCQALPFLLA